MKLRGPEAKAKRLVLLVFALLGASKLADTSRAQTVPKAGEPLIPSVQGPELFHAYCASCHGAKAHGDGPMAHNLKAKVPDLTVLARKNKGTFPASRVRDLIEGKETAQSHGSRQMPVWGPIFHQVEEDQDFGEVRLANLVKYIESIQRK